MLIRLNIFLVLSKINEKVIFLQNDLLVKLLFIIYLNSRFYVKLTNFAIVKVFLLLVGFLSRNRLSINQVCESQAQNATLAQTKWS